MMDESLTSDLTKDLFENGNSAKHWSVSCTLPKFHGKMKHSTPENQEEILETNMDK